MRNHLKWVVALAMALHGCSVDTDATGLAISCDNDKQCPSGLQCAEAFNLCVSGTAGDGPALVGVPVVTPNPALRTSDVTVSFDVDKALGSAPQITLDSPSPIGFIFIGQLGVDLRSFAAATSGQDLPPGQWPITATLLGDDGTVSVDVLLGSVTVDVVPPKLAGPVVVTPPLVGARDAFTVAFNVDEDLGAAPDVEVAWSSGDAAVLTLDTMDARAATFSLSPTTDAPNGLADIRIAVQDLAGNSVTYTAYAAMTVDAVGPLHIPAATVLRVLPTVHNPLRAINAASRNSVIDVFVAFDEPVDGDPVLTAQGPGTLPLFSKVFAAGATFQFELVFDDTVDYGALSSGEYAIAYDVMDVLGNQRTDTLGLTFMLDVDPPSGPDTSAGMVRHVRAPFGTVTDGQSPAQALTAQPGAFATDSDLLPPWAVVFDRSDLATAVELGRARVNSDGSIARLELSAADRPQIFVAAMDDAGNLMGDTSGTASPVISGTWSVTFGQKISGASGPNPHRILRTSSFDGALIDTEPADYTPISGLDGSTLQIAPRLTADSSARGANGQAGRVPYALQYIPEQDSFLLQRGSTSDLFAEYTYDLWNVTPFGWQRIDAGVDRPSNRRGPAIAYDSIRRKLLFVGGSTVVPGNPFPSSVTYSDTWEWDGTWERRCDMIPLHDDCGAASTPSRAAAAYDAFGQRVVVIGGFIQGPLSSDTTSQARAFDGSQWTSFPAVGKRGGAALAFDPLTGQGLLFGGSIRNMAGTTVLTDTQFFDGTAWQAIVPTTAPPGGTDVHMVFDAFRRVWVLVAPPAAGNKDVWEFYEGDWHRRDLVGGPPAAELFAIAYDSLRGRVVYVGAGGLKFWSIDDTGWHQLNWNTTHPSLSGNAFYHPGLKRVVLQTAASTWLYDGESWEQDEAAGPGAGTGGYHDALGVAVWVTDGEGSPLDVASEFKIWRKDASCTSVSGYCWFSAGASISGRAETALAYDANRQRVVMFGGQSEHGTLPRNYSYPAQTWEFGDFGTGTCGAETYCWQQQSPAASPPGHARHQMGFDGESIILSGGYIYRVCASMGVPPCGPSSGVKDVWRYDGSTWTKVSDDSGIPIPEAGNRMVWVEDRRALLYIDGSSDTWRWDGSAWFPEPFDGAFGRPSAVAFDRSRGALMVKVAGETVHATGRTDDLVPLVWDTSGVQADPSAFEQITASIWVDTDSFAPGELDLLVYNASTFAWERLAVQDSDQPGPLSHTVARGQWHQWLTSNREFIVGVQSRYGVDASQSLAIDHVELVVDYRLSGFGTCGDGLVGPDEQCDPANPQWSVGCDVGCELTSTCGDGIATPDEACDDSNMDEDDGCTSRCVRDLCCEPNAGPGCGALHSTALEACVCTVAPLCCTQAWTSQCVALVGSEGCGSCD